MAKSTKMKPLDGPEEVELSDELAWRVHENAKGWIAQVDIKAAAALAIEAAVLGFAFAIITTSGMLAALTSLSHWIVAFGLLLLLASVILSILVLLPRIKLKEPKPEDRGYLYFGHLRLWDAEKLSKVLKLNHVNDNELATQVIKMSQISWRKHVVLQWSLYLLLAGVVVIGALYLLLVVGLFPQVIGDLAECVPSQAVVCP